MSCLLVQLAVSTISHVPRSRIRLSADMSLLHLHPTFSFFISSCLLLSLDLIGGLLDVVPVQSLAFCSCHICVCIRPSECTHFTKFSSAGLFALIGGEVGSSAFLPPMESATPVNVTPRVAMASCNHRSLAHVQFQLHLPRPLRFQPPLSLRNWQ
jgi:hypothetical protein